MEFKWNIGDDGFDLSLSRDVHFGTEYGSPSVLTIVDVLFKLGCPQPVIKEVMDCLESGFEQCKLTFTMALEM